MMADQDQEKVEYIPPAEYSAKIPFDYKTLLPGGLGTDPAVTEQFKKANKATEDYAQALEDRFKNPNWFRVAAGFAKPQLGGFLASLGSASTELGRQQEAARAIAPTVARMRAEVAAGQYGFEQRMAQKRMWDEINAGKVPMTSQVLQKLGEFGTDTDIYKAAKQKFDTEQTIAGTKSTELGTTVEAQQAAAKYPYMDVGDFLSAAQKGNIDTAKDNLIKIISEKGYHDPKELRTMGVDALYALNQGLQNQFTEKSLDNAATAAKMADSATSQLQTLSMARQLASSPKLKKLLGLESGSTALSALFGWIAGGGDANLSRLSNATRQLAEQDPSAFADFQILRKALASNLATAREGITNPSVASTELLAQTTPDPRMARDAIIKLLDIQANDVNQTLGRAKAISSTKDASGKLVNPNVIQMSPEYISIGKFAEDRKKAILSGSYMDDRLPAFYSPYHEEAPGTAGMQIPGQKPKTQAQQPTVAAAASPLITLDSIRKALEQARSKQKNQP